MEGKVVQRAECRPVEGGDYMKLKRDSFMKAAQPVRVAQQLDKVVQNYRPVANHTMNVSAGYPLLNIFKGLGSWLYEAYF